jgi:hypothetical protein
MIFLITINQIHLRIKNLCDVISDFGADRITAGSFNCVNGADKRRFLLSHTYESPVKMTNRIPVIRHYIAG